MEEADLDWVVDKASGLLYDKVKEGPLKEEDVDLAYVMIAERRLKKMFESSSSGGIYEDAREEVMSRLRKIALKLNDEYWDA